MKVEVRHRPSFATIFAELGPGDSITAESDAMASMDSDVEMTTGFNGGFLLGLLLKFFGGESLFVNTFRTLKEKAQLVLTQGTPGDIQEVDLQGQTLLLQPGAFIAATSGIKIGVGWAGFASFIGREGLFRLKVSGTGKVWFGAYGGIFERDVDREYVVDTGHLVAYEPTISLKMALAGGIFSSFFSGEGLVSRVQGQGRIYLQSRSMDGLAAWTNGHI
ncbi:MAG: TIGR00266 family protein [Deltaproteobacteria bacterium]|nr:TIGR00266 family protein [Deltaproteobacteria bacterium]